MDTPAVHRGARHVQHLRLRCDEGMQAAHVSRVADRLAEALRCASLPQAPGRVLLVRRWDLGRLPPADDAIAWTLHLETAARRAGWHWVRGDTAAAAQAPAVWFAHVAHAAATAWAWRCAGRALGAWYWRAALPGVPLAAPLPVLRSALRRWLDGQVGPGAAAAWWPAASGEGEGAAVDPRSEVARLPSDVAAAAGAAGAVGALSLGERASPDAVRKRSPGDADLASSPAATVPDAPTAQLPRAASKRTAHRGDDRTLTPSHGATRPPLPIPIAAVPGEPGSHGAPPARRALRGRSGEAPTADPIDPYAAASRAGWPRRSVEAPGLSAHTDPFGPPQPTCVGGLLLLLPALSHIGWAGQHRDATDFAALARAALVHLRPPPEDPMHACMADLAGDRPLAARMPAARDTWRDLRGWLRQAVGIGPAHLLWRPAALRWDGTHIDLHFSVRDADLRVRRAGLDQSPGWLPWLGRVVTVHFDEPR